MNCAISTLVELMLGTGVCYERGGVEGAIYSVSEGCVIWQRVIRHTGSVRTAAEALMMPWRQSWIETEGDLRDGY
jgi:hypothetical protein